MPLFLFVLGPPYILLLSLWVQVFWDQRWAVVRNSDPLWAVSRLKRFYDFTREVAVDLDRFVATELCNRFPALPFSAINLGVFCGFWENKFYLPKSFQKTCFEKSQARLVALPVGEKSQLDIVLIKRFVEWKFGCYVVTELWLELGRYVATKQSTCLVAT
ncbi:hypothetical protein F2Q69_00042331 [Brassica cretica]|uniref:Uncharacterized protein n=1 Tax=Brassica cretica TaxID=69181 RepID=A0A8S9NPG0_BRACR|nr:hypothetical protein F2Q69_00042331 [Brassica cretica]